MFKSNPLNFVQSFLSFLKQLFSTRWRSLLILFIGVYIPLQIFGLLAVEVWKHEGGFPWDVPILMAVHKTSQAQLDVFAATLTKFGSISIVYPIVTAIALMFLFYKRWRSLSYLYIVMVGSSLISYTTKILMHRARPHLWESFYPPELDYAFPSGHAMTSMALVAALVILTWGSFWFWPLLAIGSLFVVGIAWTRLYLGVHFPSDIIAGWMVSIALAFGVSLLIKPHLTDENAVNDTEPDDTEVSASGS